jgi:hypothetical protein
MSYDLGRWSGGLAEWIDGDTAYLSVAFTWRLEEAWSRAVWYRTAGYKVRAGGPGVFTRKHFLADVAELGGDVSDAIIHHNPMATMASRGCPVGCWFCIVPKMEGKSFTLLPDFPVRPVLCDNNLSALPPDYQQFIVDRYLSAGVPLLDANSGFEPTTFDDEVFARWAPILKGPWRFGFDETTEGENVARAFRILKDIPPRRKQVYTMIGHEPFALCMDRIDRVIAAGGEPYVQPFIKLNSLTKKPAIRHDWTLQRLRHVQRWVNRHIWRKAPFSEYDASVKSNEPGASEIEAQLQLEAVA